MNRSRRLLASLALTALVAAGCSSGDDTTDVTEPEPDTTTSAPGTTDSEPDTEPDTTTTESIEPIELTASFRGVTEEVIRVGIVGIDFDALAAAGVDFGAGDAAAIYTAALESINVRGGILGRRLELFTERYLPIGATEADAVCAKLTQDEEVFVVVGAIRLDNVLCYTELNDTAVISLNQQNQERIDRSNAPYVTVRGRNDTRSTSWAEAMVGAGVFEGETVGVIGAIDVDEELYNETLAALRAAGVDPVEGLVPANDGDVNANAADSEIVLERFRSEGVTVTVHASPTATAFNTASGVGYETTWLQNPAIGAGTLTTEGVDLDYVDGMLTLMPTPVGTVDQPAMADDPAVAECVASIEANGEETVDFALGADAGNVNHAINACGIATILELAVTAAGPDLTNESFAAALASIGDFSMAGFPSAALGPDDTDAASPGQLARFSAADEAWEFVE